MAAETKFTYPKSQTVSGVVNDAILKQELDDAGLSVPVNTVYQQGSDVVIIMVGNATAADETAVGGVVSAHEGSSFSEDFQRAEENTQQDTLADNDPITVVELMSGPLRAGAYDVEWYGEHKLSAATAGGATKLLAQIGRNGATPSTRGADSKPAHWDWGQVFGKLPFGNIKDGETIDVRLQLQRQGGGLTTETAQCQRVRIFLTRVGD
jgi:hypothetical protein